MSSNDFIAALRLSEEECDVALAIGKVLADLCGVSVEQITATSKVEECHRSMTQTTLDGWDELDFVLRLERELGQRIVTRPGELSSYLARRQARLRALGQTDQIGEWMHAVLPRIRRGLIMSVERRQAIADRALRLRKIRRQK